MNTYVTCDTSRVVAVPETRSISRLGQLAAILRVWEERYQSRRDLARLEPDQLKDIGVDAASAYEESRKPFWRA